MKHGKETNLTVSLKSQASHLGNKKKRQTKKIGYQPEPHEAFTKYKCHRLVS